MQDSEKNINAENQDSEKFYNTYGKETSFEIFPREASYKAPESERPAPPQFSLAASIKKYVALTVFIALVTTVILVGGIFMLGFLAIVLLGMLIRTIFFGSRGSSGIFIIKK
jgi:hypothetical protein